MIPVLLGCNWAPLCKGLAFYVLPKMLGLDKAIGYAAWSSISAEFCDHKFLLD